MYNIECRLKMIFNKSVIILGVLYLFPLGAKCQELDSIASEKLPEIVVKAQMQHTDASSSTYTPTTRQKIISAKCHRPFATACYSSKSTSILLTMQLRHQADRMSQFISTIFQPRQKRLKDY